MRSWTPSNWNLPPGVSIDDVDPPEGRTPKTVEEPPDYWIEDEKVLDEVADLPYPWCAWPEICRGKGSCPKDPSCGD